MADDAAGGFAHQLLHVRELKRWHLLLCFHLYVQVVRPPQSSSSDGSSTGAYCSGAPFVGSLSADCLKAHSRLNGASSSSSSSGTNAVGAGSAGAAQQMPAIGSDPAFLSKYHLYAPEVAAFPQDWYNTTAAAHQVGESGVPFGFWPQSVQGV